jgi:hypothetical protein
VFKFNHGNASSMFLLILLGKDKPFFINVHFKEWSVRLNSFMHGFFFYPIAMLVAKKYLVNYSTCFSQINLSSQSVADLVQESVMYSLKTVSNTLKI